MVGGAEEDIEDTYEQGVPAVLPINRLSADLESHGTTPAKIYAVQWISPAALSTASVCPTMEKTLFLSMTKKLKKRVQIRFFRFWTRLFDLQRHKTDAFFQFIDFLNANVC